jgi:hypothetical protein
MITSAADSEVTCTLGFKRRKDNYMEIKLVKLMIEFSSQIRKYDSIYQVFS